jgi:hypothetical protein
LNEYKLLAHVAKEIDKLRQEQSAFLDAGRVETYQEYRYICGVIRGLNHADFILNDLVQRLEKSDD